MIRQIGFAIGLCIVIMPPLSSQAKKFPKGLDGEPPKNSISGLYYVLERAPVYRVPLPGQRAIFYLPKNSRVQIEGRFDGWGVFSTYVAERFKELLQEAAPDADAQYGWVRLDGLRRDEAAKSSCPNIPPLSSKDDYFDCGGEYDNVSSTDVVVFLMGYRYTGHTYRRINNTRLNQCIKTCRDDDKCVGFFYLSGASQCELKDDGGVAFESADPREPEPPHPMFSGVKLID